MKVQLLCPGCEREMVLPIPAVAGSSDCPFCRRELSLFPAERLASGGPLTRCVVCGGERFYTQRDFNQRVGCLIAGVGAALSPFTYGLSLLVCLAIDFGLYLMLKEATLCYRCGAVYRGVPRNPDHGPFDLHVATIEMEEKKYLEQTPR